MTPLLVKTSKCKR